MIGSYNLHAVELGFNMTFSGISRQTSTRVNSLKVHFPSLQYSVNLVDLKGESSNKNHLIMTSSEFSADLANPVVTMTSLLKLTCKSTEEKSCSLPASMDVVEFRRLFLQKGFVNTTATSERSSFISAFLGDHHFIRNADKSNLGMPKERAITHPDNDQSSIPREANCTLLNGDNVYSINACSLQNVSFYAFFIDTKDSAGTVSFVKSITTWDLVDKVFAQTDLIANYRESDFVVANASVSLQRNQMVSQANALYAHGGEEKFVGHILGGWIFSNDADKGHIHAEASTKIPHQSAVSFADFAYANNNFSVDAKTTRVGDVIKSAKIFGQGQYGGNINDWYIQLTRSAAYVNDNFRGGANGIISSTIPNDGKAGKIDYEVHVTDGQHEVSLDSRGLAQWDSPSKWSEAGKLQAASYYNMPTVIYWDAVGDFQYGDNRYALYLQDLTKANEKQLLVQGDGTYGGDLHAW